MTEPAVPKTALTQEQQEFLMRAALQEARMGMSEGEAPIGCVIARPFPKQADSDSADKQTYVNIDIKIIARGHNRMVALQSKIAHAEIVAFENAAGQGQGEPLLPLDSKDAILVSTLEPCVMCLGACMEAGVQAILFGLEAPADNGTQRVKPPQSPESNNPTITGGILAHESRRLFEEWLQGKEGTPQAKFVEQLLALTSA